MDRLTVPKVGDPLKAKWAQEVVDEIRRQEVVPGNGLKKKVTEHGTVLEMESSKKQTIKTNVTIGAGTSFLAKIIGGSATTYWTVQLYPNGMDGEPASGTYYAVANELYANGTNLIGKWVIVHFFPSAIICGEEIQ